jgi:hypothetical protein
MLRYLIYRTDFDNTIVRESATNNPGTNEASLFTDFIIPEIQPLYLWRVDGTDVIPNDDQTVRDWLDEIAPAPTPDDLVTYSQLTGATVGKMDAVPTADAGNVAIFDAEGNVEDGGLTIAEITGLTTYDFIGSGGTNVDVVGNTVTISSTLPTGTTVTWGDIVGTLSDQTDLQDALDDKLNITDFNSYTGSTDTRLSGIEDDIVFLSGATDNKLETTDFNTYTGLTNTRLENIEGVTDIALTGVTNLGTGSTIGGVSGRDVTLKSISVLGNLTISGDADNIVLSGTTGIQTVSWGDIVGTLSDQTDLYDELTGITAQSATKLDITDFNIYTGLTDTRLENIEEVTDIAITGSTNGLTTDGRNIKLGGELDENTVISGTTNSLSIDVNGINLTDNGGSDVNIESDGGSVIIKGNDGTSVTQTQIDVSEIGIVITDNRTTSTGVEYAGDYSADFVARSLVDKAYVDAVASGLVPKANVQAVTTQSDGNIDLTGGTFGGTIDGVTIVNDDRVLITEQTLGQENGIYVYASGSNTFTRAEDFDGTPDGEVVDGNIVPVLSGVTYSNTIWILVTPNPITIDVTPLTFSFFSRPVEYTEGVGIDITANQISVDGQALAGNSISWTGNTFNVDINSGTLGTALSNIEDDIVDIQNDISFISGVTDSKLDITDFNAYTGSTDTRLDGIESDITFISGVTDTKLDTDVFEAYTATTNSKIQLVSTGDTDINTIVVTEIVWDEVSIIDTNTYSWTGGTSSVEILETGEYELKYNITLKNSGGSASRSVGSYVVLNNDTIIELTGNGAVVTGTDSSGSLSLPPVVLSLNSGDILDLVGFRVGGAGTVNSVGGSTYLHLNRIS